MSIPDGVETPPSPSSMKTGIVDQTRPFYIVCVIFSSRELLFKPL